ncbi:hypothetical protein [Mesomycoplasma hyopneumoniae]|uniref:hypothetical protein n=1 Tax=Mesomycoplasma hyopneumoniae TaxID=2099 RepID=UPI0038578111
MYKKQKNRKNKLIFSRFFPFLTFSPLFFLTSAINDPQKQIISQEKPQTDNDKGQAGQSDQEKKGKKIKKKLMLIQKKIQHRSLMKILKKIRLDGKVKKRNLLTVLLGRLIMILKQN